MIPEKAEDCPSCGGTLTQAGYDLQTCACGWTRLPILPPADRARDQREDAS